MLAVAVAFMAAPFVGVLLSSLFVTPLFGEFSAWGLYFGFGLFFAYPCALVVGLPLYLLARRRWREPSVWQCAGGGLISAVAGLYFVLTPEDSLYFHRTWLLNTALALSAGLASGSALWLLLRNMR